MLLTLKVSNFSSFVFNMGIMIKIGFPGGSVVKNPPANVGDVSSIPGSGKSPGKGNGNPLQYSYLGNLMDRRAWRAIVHGVLKELENLATKQHYTNTHTYSEEGNGNSLQYSFLENPMDGGAWQATIHRVAEFDMTEAT